MNIQLKKLTINNFKGIKNLVIDFNHTTEISGRNESGKTTVADAYFWLLFGKNSEDSKDFSIKNTIDTSLNRNDHEVIGVLDVDGADVVLKRVFKEKWQTKRGSPVAEFTGNETIYFYNDVPCSQNEYNSKVSALLSESIAKLITNPFAFNALKWEQRREVLTKIAGDVNDSDIADTNKSDFAPLLLMLNGKTLSDFKKEVAAKKKKIKETKDLVPARIDESSRSKPEKQDFEFIEKSLSNKRGLIEKIDLAISDKVKAHREASLSVIQKQNDLNRLKMQLQNLEADAKRESQKEINTIGARIGVLEFAYKHDNKAIQNCETEIAFLKTKIEKLNTENEKLREDWKVLNNEVMPVMDADSTVCPSCKQSLPEDKIEVIKADYEKNYNNNKQRKLATINGHGQSNKSLIESYDKEIMEYESSLTKLHASIESVQVELSELQNKKIALNKPVSETLEITSLKEKIANFVSEDAPVIDDAELKQRKTELQNEVNELIVKLTAKEQIEKINTRIAELEKQERELGQEIADLERTEFTIDKFVKCKMDAVEQRVNSMFKLVKFRMFETQINGGLSEACTCLVNGVPFSDCNNAGRINAGLDIINTLSSFYNVFAPVWVDNSEAVNEIYPIASQLITLKVTTGNLTII